MKTDIKYRVFGSAVLATGIVLLGGSFAGAALANGGPTPPDLTVCDGVDCDSLNDEICSDAGFRISLTSYTPATTQNSGTATYVYEVCSPPAGVCAGGTGLRAGESCLENDFCRSKGQSTDPAAYCTRECATDDFYGLSHFDVTFPELGGIESCLSSTTNVTGSCAVVDGNGTTGDSSVGSFVKGDASCFDSTSASFAAKCDETNLAVGDCVEMTLNIAGETTGLGLGAAVVVDKESTTCTGSCLAGPSCERCDDEQEDGAACLTRTLGFWGTHPWITNDFVAVTVCGETLTCDGAPDVKSNPACGYGSCDDVMEGLGSSPGQEGIKNDGGSAYVAMIKQLTAAKLNLNATAALTDGTCADWEYDGYSIGSWIDICEGLCDANHAAISNSGCIEALNDFNNSQDVLDVTPAPFDRPPVDDSGNVSGADSTAFTAAQGNNKKSKLVIGKGSCGS